MGKRETELGRFLRAKTGRGDIDLSMPSSGEMERSLTQRPDATAVHRAPPASREPAPDLSRLMRAKSGVGDINLDDPTSAELAKLGTPTADATAVRRPMSRLMDDIGESRFAPAVRLAPKASRKAPTHEDVHASLDSARNATDDDEKRRHVFKALTALNNRRKASSTLLKGISPE